MSTEIERKAASIGSAVIPPEEVPMVRRERWEELRRLWQQERVPIAELARRFELDRKTARRCLRNPAWRPYSAAGAGGDAADGAYRVSAGPGDIAYVSKQLGHSSIQITVDLYGHFIPGADPHHVEGLAEAIEEAGRQLNATQPQPDPASKKPASP